MRPPILSTTLRLLVPLALFGSAHAQTYTGALEGTDALIALVVSGEAVVAYTCDNGTLAQWFRGLQQSVPLELQSTDQQARLTVRLSPLRATGRVTLPDGTVRSFRATRSSGTAGLFRSETLNDGVSFIGGWVLLENGQQRGSILGGGLIRPAGTLTLGSPPQAALEDLGALNPFVIDEGWVASRVQ